MLVIMIMTCVTCYLKNYLITEAWNLFGSFKIFFYSYRDSVRHCQNLEKLNRKKSQTHEIFALLINCVYNKRVWPSKNLFLLISRRHTYSKWKFLFFSYWTFYLMIFQHVGKMKQNYDWICVKFHISGDEKKMRKFLIFNQIN